MIVVRFLLPPWRQKKPEQDDLQDFLTGRQKWLPPKPKKLKPEDYIGEYKWFHKEPNPFIESSKRDKHPNAWEDLINSQLVVTTATGAELELIRTHFQNIPWIITQRKKCEWVGDFAKFIALNFDFRK